MKEYPKPATRQCTQKILEQMNNPIYKIIDKDRNNNLGFFCYVKNDKKSIPVVIINKFISDNDYYNDTIKLKINDVIKIIEIGKSIYKNREYNISIIEIIDNNLSDITFFEIDDNLYIKDNENDINYYRESIYCFNYNNENDISVSYGLINNIYESEIKYNCNINSNICGYPIFNLANNKLIGIHYNKSIYFNKGILLNNIINEFIDSLNPNNEIIITLHVDEKDISDNKKIYFLDNYDEKHEHLIELNKINTELYIDNEIQEYHKYFEPQSSGDYNIKLNFKINLTDCSYMFAGCKNITNIKFISFNTKYITNMSYLFYRCEKIKKINLYCFNTTNLIDMSYMFNSCRNLNDIDLSSFNIENVKNIDYIFYGCDNLQNIYSLSLFSENEIDILVNISKDEVNKRIYILDNFDEKHDHLKEFNQSNTKLYIGDYEYNYKKFFKFKKEGNYTVKLKFNFFLNDCSYMFARCKNIINIKFKSFNTQCIKNMSYMFFECENLNKLDLSSFDTKNVKDMSYMFCSCENLNNIDLSSFDTKNVEDMRYMFHGCLNLKSLNLISFDTENVTNMKFMFCYCENLKNLDLSSFDTKNVIDMSSMFANCHKLKNIITSSSFNTNNVIEKRQMFDCCFNLETVSSN